jgi:hypothetical protein
LAKTIGVDGVAFSNLSSWPKKEMRRCNKTFKEWDFNYEEQGLWNDPDLEKYLNKARIVSEKSGLEFHTPIHTKLVNESKNKEIKTVKDCSLAWTRAGITTDGNINVCCFAETRIGNIKNAENLEAIWNGKTAQDLRKYITQNKIHPLCKNGVCQYVQNMKQSQTTPKSIFQKLFSLGKY